MRAIEPGWYCFTAPNATDKCAMDRQGPFETREAVVAWITEHGLQYRSNADAYERAVYGVESVAVPYAVEMTDQQSHMPWATAIHYIDRHMTR